MSYFQDHNLSEPGKSRRPGGSALNPNIDDFITDEPRTSTFADEMREAENMLAVASLFGSIRDRPYLADNEAQQTLLDNLISQLLEEANASAKGKPPASKKFIHNLPTVEIRNEKIDATCSVCVESFFSHHTSLGTAPTSKAIAKQLPCHHRFHAECIVPWLELHNTCPICRREYPTDDEEYERKKKEAERAASAAAAPLEDDEEEDWDPMYG
ncbi:hypothetical protein SpCBS45565_g02236 [Spizellomyces sp. 'palustris']|nr:hypothetical protein SpCBS45565_g02236 [Spizellomyces sp. 'palustris']